MSHTQAAKSDSCVISIIINAGPTPKQVDFTSVSVTTVVLLCQHVIVNKPM